MQEQIDDGFERAVAPAGRHVEHSQLDRVALVARALTAGLDVGEIVDIVVRQGMAGLDAEGGVLATVEPSGAVTPVTTVGYPRDLVVRFDPLTTEQEYPLTVAARSNEPVWVPSPDDAAQRFPALLRNGSISQAWAAIPLMASGRPFGVLAVSFLTPHEFSETERMFLQALADVGALALKPHLAPAAPAPRPTAPPAPEAAAELVAPGARPVLALLHEVQTRIFATSVRLAIEVTYHEADPATTERLHLLIDELDAVRYQVQGTASALHGPWA